LVWHARSGFPAGFLDHLGEVRMILEPEAAAHAALRRGEFDLADMRNWIEHMSEPDISASEFVEADLGLHLAVARAAGNPLLVSVSTLIEVALVAMLTKSSPVESPDSLRASVDQHRAIVEAIAAKDPDAARSAMRAVIKVGIDRANSVSDTLENKKPAEK
jgi:DNA-binding FadR family transcriptional regulator